MARGLVEAIRPSSVNAQMASAAETDSLEIYKKYGKSFKDIELLKLSFIQNEKQHIADSDKINELYLLQPAREKCKICAHVVKKSPDFILNRIPYFFCENCYHLNGLYEESHDFCRKIYSESSIVNYSNGYTEGLSDEFYAKRDKVYIPKANFLKETLLFQNINCKDIAICDIGAGSGYFVSAAAHVFFANPVGYEVSRDMVEYANSMLGKRCDGGIVHLCNIDDLETIIKEQNSNTISMIGVLEHLQNPHSVLDAIYTNPNIKYLYLSLPLFSLSVMNAYMNQESFFARHLGGAHTHLFTKQSISWLLQKYNLEVMGEYWFGSDIHDYFRAFVSRLELATVSSDFYELSIKWWGRVIDSLQLALDKKEQCSEVHLVLRKKSNYNGQNPVSP